MVAELITGLSLFKTMFDITKGLKETSDAAIRNAAVIELQEKILAAQLHQATLIESVGTLEKEVANLKAWDREKARYELKDVGSQGRNSVLAYALKPEAQGTEPFHLLCANCYENQRKSILQGTTELRMRLRVHRCPNCKSEFEFSFVPPTEPIQQPLSDYDPLKGF